MSWPRTTRTWQTSTAETERAKPWAIPAKPVETTMDPTVTLADIDNESLILRLCLPWRKAGTAGWNEKRRGQQ